MSACAGTPLLLKWAASSLRSGGSFPWALADSAFENSLLLERFVGVGDEAFRYVKAAAMLGVRFQPDLAGALAELEPTVWQSAHARLLHVGLLNDLPGGRQSTFVHPLFVQALFESQTTFDRQRLHVRAFQLMVDRGAPDAVAAEHAVAPRMNSDPVAIAVIARAGREALGQGAL